MTNDMKRQPVLHVFICDEKIYEQGDLSGGWVTLPVPEYRIRNFLKTIASDEYLITDYDLLGSCFQESQVQDAVFCCRRDLIRLNDLMNQERNRLWKKR